ncbi:MAG: NVEALA domain-containing protein [Tannerella sp.]|jgi:hypothetical protein|nr:NVEALA domain-containing protein [Tannerella sp.]
MNKKRIFGSIAVLAIAAMATFYVNVNTQENGLSDVLWKNVEALAEVHNGGSDDTDEVSQENPEGEGGSAYELPEVTITCGQYYGQCWAVDEFPRYAWIGDITCRFVGNMNYYCA